MCRCVGVSFDSLLVLVCFLSPCLTPRCSTWEERPTVLLSREEYANLFHALRELFNTFQTLEQAGIIGPDTVPSDVRGKIRVIWVDGHAKVCMYVCMCECMCVCVCVCVCVSMYVLLY